MLSIPVLPLTHCRILSQEAAETLISLLRQHEHLPHNSIMKPHKV